MPDPSEIDRRIRALVERLNAEPAGVRDAPPPAPATEVPKPRAPAARRSWRFGFGQTLVIFQIPTAIAFVFLVGNPALPWPWILVFVVAIAAVQSGGGLLTAGLELGREQKDPPPAPSLARALLRTLTFPLLIEYAVVPFVADIAATGWLSEWNTNGAFFPVLRSGTAIVLVGVGVPLAIYAVATHRREKRAFNERRAGA
jgi:hypothetical protein